MTGKRARIVNCRTHVEGTSHAQLVEVDSGHEDLLISADPVELESSESVVCRKYSGGMHSK
jgi:hypothetical protein